MTPKQRGSGTGSLKTAATIISKLNPHNNKELAISEGSVMKVY